MLMGQLYGIIADVKSSSLYPPTNLNLFSKSYTKGWLQTSLTRIPSENAL